MNNNIFDLPISKNNYKCVGPCYPPNTPFYHNLYLSAIIDEKNYICPIKRTFDKEHNKEIIYDKCNADDVTPNYENFDIFDDSVQIANTNLSFLSQIYKIDNINNAIEFISESLDILPIYSQKRILNCIYYIWINNDNFPQELFSKKVKNVLKEIYKLDIKLDIIKKKIISIKNKEKYNDIFLYFYNKYYK
jgi:hypothetical protein